MLMMFGGIAAFAVGFIVFMVVLLIVGTKMWAGAKKKGVVVSDGISKDEVAIFFDEFTNAVKESQIDAAELLKLVDPSELIELIKILAKQKEVENRQAHAAKTQTVAQKLKVYADKAVADAQKAD